MAIQYMTAAGMALKYALPKASDGTRPTSGYTEIVGVKAIPAFGNDVPTLDATPLSATVNRVYVEDLRDSGGSISITVNDAEAFRSSWSSVMAALSTAQSQTYPADYLWFEYCYPTGKNMPSYYVPAKPVQLGFGGAEVGTVMENNGVILPVADALFSTASTT